MIFVDHHFLLHRTLKNIENILRLNKQSISKFGAKETYFKPKHIWG
jgi:hypothetical protein